MIILDDVVVVDVVGAFVGRTSKSDLPTPTDAELRERLPIFLRNRIPLFPPNPIVLPILIFTLIQLCLKQCMYLLY